MGRFPYIVWWGSLTNASIRRDVRAAEARRFELQITKRRKTELIQTIIPILIKNKVRVVICTLYLLLVGILWNTPQPHKLFLYVHQLQTILTPKGLVLLVVTLCLVILLLTSYIASLNKKRNELKSEIVELKNKKLYQGGIIIERPNKY